MDLFIQPLHLGQYPRQVAGGDMRGLGASLHDEAFGKPIGRIACPDGIQTQGTVRHIEMEIGQRSSLMVAHETEVEAVDLKARTLGKFQLAHHHAEGIACEGFQRKMGREVIDCNMMGIKLGLGRCGMHVVADIGMADEERIDAEIELRRLALLLLVGEGIYQEAEVGLTVLSVLIYNDVRIEQADVAYRDLPVFDERHPLHLGRYPVNRKQVLALLVVNLQAIDDKVVREQPMHSAQIHPGADTVLQFGGQNHGHPALHPRGVQQYGGGHDNERRQAQHELYVSSSLNFHFTISAY